MKTRLTLIHMKLSDLPYNQLLVATTSMKNERIPRKGPKLDQTDTKRILDDIIARAQAPFEEEKLELNSVLVALARIVMLIMTLVIKLGAHYHFGILIHQSWQGISGFRSSR